MRQSDENDEPVYLRQYFLSGETRTLAAQLIRTADKLDFDCGRVD